MNYIQNDKLSSWQNRVLLMLGGAMVYYTNSDLWSGHWIQVVLDLIGFIIIVWLTGEDKQHAKKTNHPTGSGVDLERFEKGDDIR